MVYEIKQGKHRSGYFLKLTCKNKLSGVIEFIDDVSYKIDLQKDTNKIIGLSDNWHHHKDSCRLGWRWNLIEEKIEIMTIVYSRGKRTIKHLCFAEEDKEYQFEIIITRNSYILRFNTDIAIIRRTRRWKFIRSILHPYFGGKTKSPKDFNIKIELNE